MYTVYADKEPKGQDPWICVSNLILNYEIFLKYIDKSNLRGSTCILGRHRFYGIPVAIINKVE